MKHTYRMGIVGNCSYMAHINKHSNVAWLCWPRFDSSYVFGNLIDDERGGEFSILPESEKYKTHQSYIENTNILKTVIRHSLGTYCIIDFAPRFLEYERYYKPLMLVRKIEPISGLNKIIVNCDPRGDYGEIVPSPQIGSNHIFYSGLPDSLRLTTNIPLNYILNRRAFTVKNPIYLVLTYGQPLEAPLKNTAEQFLLKTTNYWQLWCKNCSIEKFHQKRVIRSALALKLHQYEDTGAIIASGTTSLPESPDSGRTWDYRYCWLRDSYYTLNALSNIGCFEEIERYAQFIQDVPLIDGRYNSVYTILGYNHIPEEIINLKGYLGNKPVRIGNDASTQIQNDVYGQVLLSILPLYIDHRFPSKERNAEPQAIYRILDKIEEIIDEPDMGVWEFRNNMKQHCYSHLFHWAGASASIKIAEHIGDNNLYQKANFLRSKAKSMIEKSFNHNLRSYTQSIGSNEMDASLLQLINMFYLSPESYVSRKHLQALEKTLLTNDFLFYRYLHEDDFGKPQTAFLICAYWYIEALANVGRIDEAVEGFEKLLKYSNYLGLMSEDVDAKTHSQWGNFPQTYSHVGLMNAAYTINRKIVQSNYL